MIFDIFLKITDHFPKVLKILQDLFEDHRRFTEHFLKIS